MRPNLLFLSRTLGVTFAGVLALPVTAHAETTSAMPPPTPSAAAAQTPPPQPTQTTQAMVTSEPVPISAQPSAPPDRPDPSTTTWVNRPLLITSSIVLVGSYVPMAVVAYTSERPADQTNLYYPVVGPWMNLADRECDVRPCNNETLTKALLIADGIGQGLGALGVVTSFFLPDKTTHHWYLIGDSRVHAAPTRMGTAGYGFAASGTF